MHSRDADGLRESLRGHAIEHARTDGHFGGLGANRAHRQTPAREHLQAVLQRLGQRAPVIAARYLPLPPAAAADGVERIVEPSRAQGSLRPGRRARNRCAAPCPSTCRVTRRFQHAVFAGVAQHIVRSRKSTERGAAPKAPRAARNSIYEAANDSGMESHGKSLPGPRKASKWPAGPASSVYAARNRSSTSNATARCRGHRCPGLRARRQVSNCVFSTRKKGLRA